MRRRTRLLDANVILRYLVEDDARQAAEAERLFAACDRGTVRLVVLPEVLAECVYVLQSFYRQPRRQTASALSAFIGSPGVEMPDRPIHLDALARFAAGNLHFVDCVLAAHSVARQIPVATFDAGLKKCPGVKVERS